MLFKYLSILYMNNNGINIRCMKLLKNLTFNNCFQMNILNKK